MSIKILLVDDESSLLEQAKIFLEKIDDQLEVSTVSSAEKGLEHLDDDHFDVIVSDYQMPVTDGLDLLEEIRNERHCDKPFIMFTGKGREEVAMQALNLGADRYLRKGGDPYTEYGMLAQAIKQEFDHYKTKKLRKESEERYRRLFETAQDGMLIIDAETGTIEDANPFILDILGYSKQELVGKKVWKIGTFKSVVENKRRFEELVEEGYIRYEDKPLKTRDGEEVPVEFVSNTYEAGGKKVAQCNIREISERKKAQESLSRLIEIMSKNTSSDFYDSVVEELCEWLDMDGAFIGAVDNDGEVSTLSMIMDGKKIPDYSYSLSGTPCKEVTTSGPCLYRENVTEYFPEDDELIEFDIEGYMGVPVKDESGETLGVLWAVSKEKITDVPSNWDKLLRMMAKRTATEIKRDEYERKMDFQIKVLDNIGNAVITTDPEGEVIYWNDKAEEYYGWKTDEVIGKNILDITPSETFESKAEDIMEKIRAGEKWSGEFKLKRKDGTEFPAIVTDSPITDENGELIGIVGVTTDITDIKKMENELMERVKELNGLYRISKLSSEENSLKSIFKKSVDLISSSFQFPEKTGVKISYRDDIYRTDDFEESSRTLREDLRVDERSVGQIEVHYLDEDEKEQYFLEEEGQLLEIIARDLENIIEKKKAREEIEDLSKFRKSIIEDANIWLNVLDDDNNVLVWNKAAEEISGYSKEEVLNNDDIWEKLYPDQRYREKIFEKVSTILKDEELKGYETLIRCKDGSEKVISWNQHPLKDDDGDIIGSIATGIDRTEEKEMKKREKFLHSILRHDVGNKMQIIDGYLDLMNEYELPDEALDFLKKADNALQESKNIMNKIEELRTIEKSEETEMVNLSSVIDDIVSEHHGELEGSDIDIDVKVPDVYVKGGPLLKELFSNIIENSIKHSGCNNIIIDTKVEEDTITVSVEDDGKGILDEIKDKLFDKGFKRNSSGSGLGMYIVKEIAENYGGSVEVKDSELGGARFDIFLNTDQQR